MPSASVPRMIFAPLIRAIRLLSIPGLPTSLPNTATPSALLTPFLLALTAAIQRLDLSRDPRVNLKKLQNHKFTLWNSLPLGFMAVCALYCLYIMTTPSFPLKLGIPLAYTLALLIPMTSQFVLPATPIFSWLLLFFCARFIPSSTRPDIHVALLPALESVLYGANISDLQTRYTNALLDVIAWLPYGVMHFALPFVVAIILWVLGPRGSVQYWGKAFGWMNLLGVVTQLLFPCAAPWYEIIHGLTPANYAMPGSPGGLLRIDRVFHSSGYANTFGAAPLVFGAFPSLHSGCAVMEALFLSHFFPAFKPVYWGYVSILWWATMYLSHHYLIDLTGGACLSVLAFYLTMPEVFKDVDQIQWNKPPGGEGYELAMNREVDLDEEIRKLEEEVDFDAADEEARIDTAIGSSAGQTQQRPNALGNPLTTRRTSATSLVTSPPQSSSSTVGQEVTKPRIKKKRSVSWGETKVLGEDGQRAMAIAMSRNGSGSGSGSGGEGEARGAKKDEKALE